VAVIANPTLAPLEFLVGRWEMKLSGASFLPAPDSTATGFVVVEPIEQGGLIAMRQFVEPDGPPAATWVIGRDASRTDYTVLYSDARGVSRVYEMSLADGAWKLWRDDPEFSQRFEAEIAPDRLRMSGRWSKRPGGGEWEHDFDVDYARSDPDPGRR
jgi:hypothetical protein